jgi:predicted  nucleic acid-binding Zn-ribbon protein
MKGTVMADTYDNLDEATAALASTAERAALLIRTESARAKEQAAKTRHEMDDIRKEIRAAKSEFESVRQALQHQHDDRERIRRSAGWAWSAVALMAACVTIAVGWTAVQLTSGRDSVNNLTADVTQLRQSVLDRDAELAYLRTQLESARIAESVAKAELNAMLLQPRNAQAGETLAAIFSPAGPAAAIAEPATELLLQAGPTPLDEAFTGAE